MAIALVYAAAVWAGEASRLQELPLALIWPAAAVGFLWLAASWRSRRQVTVVVVAIGVLAAVINSRTGTSPVVAVGFGVANSLQAFVTCAVMVRLQGPTWRLRDPGDLTVLIIGSVCGSFVGALVGPVVLWAATGADLPATAGAWVIRNAVSTFVFSALALRLADRGLPFWLRDRKQAAELLAACLVILAAYSAVFIPADGLPLSFLLLPLSMWVGLRFDTTIAAAHVPIAGVFVVVLTIQERGPFAAGAPATRLLVAQAFMAVVAMVALASALRRDERKTLIARLDAVHRDAAEQAELLEAVIGSISDGIAVADADGMILVQNPAAQAMLGIAVVPRRVGESPQDHGWFRPDGTPLPKSELPLSRALAGYEVTNVDLVVRDGANPLGRVLNVSARPLPGPPGEHHAVAAFHDVTQQRRAEAELTQQAMHDPLTRLPNRVLLTDRLEHALAASARSGCRTGVLYLDLDGFKAVNDASGHAAGDDLLIEVADRIIRCVRPGDTVSRLGGDEFAVVCPDVDELETLQGVAERILEALRIPIGLAHATHAVSASIGIVLAEPDSTAEHLLRDADDAMYLAKRGGKNRAVHFADPPARASSRTRLLVQLQSALDRNELLMYGQPIFDLRTGRIAAVETLLRWQHPERGLLSPAQFLDVAEASPLMLVIGQRALEESCRLAVAWTQALGPDAPDVHVNVSDRQLDAKDLSGDVLAALHRHSLPPSRLVLELTETHLPRLAHSVHRDLTRLQDSGVRIAVDDLGAGYTSLTRLTELPVDMLKIDPTFISGLGSDVRCDAVVGAILSIGKALKLDVVAEGVETLAQAELLVAHGCDIVQGFLYAPPLPEAELLTHLREEQARRALARHSDGQKSPDPVELSTRPSR